MKLFQTSVMMLVFMYSGSQLDAASTSTRSLPSEQQLLSNQNLLSRIQAQGERLAKESSGIIIVGGIKRAHDRNELWEVCRSIILHPVNNMSVEEIEQFNGCLEVIHACQDYDDRRKHVDSTLAQSFTPAGIEIVLDVKKGRYEFDKRLVLELIDVHNKVINQCAKFLKMLSMYHGELLKAGKKNAAIQEMSKQEKFQAIGYVVIAESAKFQPGFIAIELERFYLENDLQKAKERVIKISQYLTKEYQHLSNLEEALHLINEKDPLKPTLQEKKAMIAVLSHLQQKLTDKIVTMDAEFLKRGLIPLVMVDGLADPDNAISWNLKRRAHDAGLKNDVQEKLAIEIAFRTANILFCKDHIAQQGEVFAHLKELSDLIQEHKNKIEENDKIWKGLGGKLLNFEDIPWLTRGDTEGLTHQLDGLKNHALHQAKDIQRAQQAARKNKDLIALQNKYQEKYQLIAEVRLLNLKIIANNTDLASKGLRAVADYNHAEICDTIDRVVGVDRQIECLKEQIQYSKKCISDQNEALKNEVDKIEILSS